MIYLINVHYAQKNSTTQILSDLVALCEAAWDEYPEYQHVPKDVWVAYARDELMSIPRYEITALDSSDHVVGCIILTERLDRHVGLCMSVDWQYVSLEHRYAGISRRLMRAAKCITKSLHNPSILSFTHKRGVDKYETFYKRL